MHIKRQAARARLERAEHTTAALDKIRTMLGLLATFTSEEREAFEFLDKEWRVKLESAQGDVLRTNSADYCDWKVVGSNSEPARRAVGTTEWYTQYTADKDADGNYWMAWNVTEITQMFAGIATIKTVDQGRKSYRTRKAAKQEANRKFEQINALYHNPQPRRKK